MQVGGVGRTVKHQPLLFVSQALYETVQSEKVRYEDFAVIIAPQPDNETDRLASVRAYNILDTPADPRVDALTRAAARLLHVPIVLVALVDEHRQWFKSTVGCFLPGDQTSRDVAFCAHAMLEPQQLLVVEDASKDPRFCDNPLVTDHPGIRFYAGAPLLDGAGLPLGIFCIIDTVPRQISAEDLETLRDLATAVNSTLELHRSVVDLREAAEHRQAAVELSPHLQWSASPEGQNLEFSSHTATLTGFHPEEMLGSGWQRALHPDDLAGAQQRWATSLRTGEIYESEHRLRIIDGTYRWFRAYAAPRRDPCGRIVRW